MELTLENKLKFFAQYWAQYVLRDHIWALNAKNASVGFYPFGGNQYLELKPLSSITEEDAIKCVDIEEEMGALSIKNERRAKYGRNNIYFLIHKTEVADYLRSKGYCLPWMGIPVEEMIRAGWIKLKS